MAKVSEIARNYFFHYSSWIVMHHCNNSCLGDILLFYIIAITISMDKTILRWKKCTYEVYSKLNIFLFILFIYSVLIYIKNLNRF